MNIINTLKACGFEPTHRGGNLYNWTLRPGYTDLEFVVCAGEDGSHDPTDAEHCTFVVQTDAGDPHWEREFASGRDLALALQLGVERLALATMYPRTP